MVAIYMGGFDGGGFQGQRGQAVAFVGGVNINFGGR